MAKNYISDYSTIFDADKKFIGPSDSPRLRRNTHSFLKVELANQEKYAAGLYFFHAVRWDAHAAIANENWPVI